jgi:hypothetical protein
MCRALPEGCSVWHVVAAVAGAGAGYYLAVGSLLLMALCARDFPARLQARAERVTELYLCAGGALAVLGLCAGALGAMGRGTGVVP